MLKLFTSCPRKGAFKYLKGFKIKEEQDHLTFGSAVHEAQADFYTHDFSYEAMMKKAREFLKGRGGNDLLPKAIEALDLWYETIGKDDAENCKVLEVEAEDKLILPNGFEMSVRRDTVLQDLRTNDIFIRDTKTTGWSLEGTIKNYMLSDQPILYMASIYQSKPEWAENLVGWRTDCIYMRAKKDGTFSKACRRSDVSTFTKQEIENWVNSYAVITSDLSYRMACVLEDKEPISMHFPCYNENCLAYNRVCEYRAFCHEIDTIDCPPSNFTIDTWLEDGVVLDKFKGLKE